MATKTPAPERVDDLERVVATLEGDRAFASFEQFCLTNREGWAELLHVAVTPNHPDRGRLPDLLDRFLAAVTAGLRAGRHVRPAGPDEMRLVTRFARNSRARCEFAAILRADKPDAIDAVTRAIWQHGELLEVDPEDATVRPAG